MSDNRRRSLLADHGSRLVDLLRGTRVDSGLLSLILVVLLLTIFGSAQGEVELFRSGARLPTLWTDTATTSGASDGAGGSHMEMVRAGTTRESASDRERGAPSASAGSREIAVDDALMLSRSEITITGLGDTATITARLGERSTATPRFQPDEEVPWVEGTTVLDPDALAEGRIVARAPGSAHLRVRAFGRGPAILTVRVAPEAPTAFALRAPSRVRPGDTIRVLGYRMEQVDAARLDGRPAPIIDRDSAGLAIVTPPPEPTSECRGSARTEVTLAGVRTPAELSYLAARNGEVSLDVGERMRLPDGENCLRLSAAEGAEYVLAYFDRSPVDRPETPREVENANSLYRNTADPTRVPPISVVVDDRSDEPGEITPDRAADGDDRADDRAGAGARDRPAPGGGEDRVEPLSITVSSAGEMACGTNDYRDGCAEVFDRRRPWRTGERFLISDPDESRATTADGRTAVVEDYARVVKVRDRIVYAVYEHDEDLFTPEWAAAFDQAVKALHREGLPYLRSILTRRHPVTSEASGQLLVILAQLDGPVMGRSYTGPGSGGSSAEAHALIDLDNEPAFGTLYQVLAHEMAHAWNAQYRFERGISLGVHYHEEGLAEFLANDLMRRDAGIAFTADWDGWRYADSATSAGQYGREAKAQTGLLTEGYVGLASLYRDLVTRRIEAGETVREATRAVVRGAHGNWSGLTRRMRELFPGWNPVDGILTWTLSQAVDGRLRSEIFRNAAFGEVSSPDGGWQAAGTLTAGEGTGRLRDETRYGSTGFFHLTDEIGGSFRLLSAGTTDRGSRGWGTPSDVAWMLLRVK